MREPSLSLYASITWATASYNAFSSAPQVAQTISGLSFIVFLLFAPDLGCAVRRLCVAHRPKQRRPMTVGTWVKHFFGSQRNCAPPPNGKKQPWPQPIDSSPEKRILRNTWARVSESLFFIYGSVISCLIIGIPTCLVNAQMF